MKKRLNQTQALALWMKSGKWITGKIADKELGITRLPEIIRRLKEAGRPWHIFVDDETVMVKSKRYGKTHIKRWKILTQFHYKQFVKEFCK